jgi:hypothetical protein
VLIVGEAPNRSGKTGLAGKRMADLGTVGLPRKNLLQEWPGSEGKGSAFPMALAVPAAMKLWSRTPLRVPMLFVGTRVAAAFGLRDRAEYEFLWWREYRGRRVAVMPHPSGIVLWWNDPANVEAAGEFFRELVS